MSAAISGSRKVKKANINLIDGFEAEVQRSFVLISAFNSELTFSR